MSPVDLKRLFACGDVAAAPVVLISLIIIVFMCALELGALESCFVAVEVKSRSDGNEPQMNLLPGDRNRSEQSKDRPG